MASTQYDDDTRQNNPAEDRDFFNEHPDLKRMQEDDDFDKWEKEFSESKTDSLDQVSESETGDEKDPEDTAEKAEADALTSQVGEVEDEPATDYFRTSKGKLASGSFTLGFLMGGSKRKKAILLSLVAGGVLGFGGFLGFLNNFRLKSFLENVNFHAFSRYNAAVDRRSDAWTKAYFKTRMLEWDGTNKPDADGNTLFRSRRVDTNHPFTDWYRTMRTSRFEADLLEKHGIRFTSVVDSSGRVRPGRIDINGRTVDVVPDGADGDFALVDDIIRDPARFDRMVGGIDGKIVEVFDNDKDARRAIKQAVDRETSRWQVIKRRHHRKAIANMTGVRDWRFFDKTRTKYENKKAEFQKKMITKVFPEDGRSQAFLLCILGLGGCSANTDPSNPDNRRGAGSGLPASQAQNDNDPIDSDGDGTVDGYNPVDGSDYDGAGRLAREGAGEIADQALEEGRELSEKNFRKKLIESVTKQFTSSFGGPTAIKKILDWALKFETNLARNPGTGRSKIGDSVYQARLVNAMLAFSTIMIIGDQMQSGEADPEQIDAAMEYMNGLGKSEAINYLASGEEFPENVGQTRGVATDVDATEADRELVDKCDTGEPFDEDDVVPFCDNLKPNGGSRITGLEDAWNKYVSDSPLGAILAGYRELKDNAITGFFMSIVDALGDVAAKVITPILEATGLTEAIGDVAGWLAERVLGWVGVMPCMTGMEESGGMPANCGLAGAAATAETSTRIAGGVLSAVGSPSYEYSKQLAIEYMDEQLEFMSTSERYFSLNNPQSYTSQFLARLSSDTTASGFATTLGVGSIFKSSMSFVGSIFNGKALAAEGEGQFRDTATFSGIDNYAFAKECIELDPTDPDYLAKSTNNPNITPDMATLGNEEAYVAALYRENGDSLDFDEINDINETYNCVALDNVVKGGIGYRYGFNADDGYTSSGEATNTTTTNSGLTAGTPLPGGDTTNVPCHTSPTSSFVRVEPEAYISGTRYTINLCSVHGVLVNSVVSKNYDDMFTAMVAAGYTIRGTYGFRDMAGQIAGYAGGAGAGTFAKPGYSNHQYGAAVDLTCANADGTNKYTAGTGRHRDQFLANVSKYPCLNWVHNNSANYGLLLQCDGQGEDGEIRAKSGGCEWWHISTTGK